MNILRTNGCITKIVADNPPNQDIYDSVCSDNNLIKAIIPITTNIGTNNQPINVKHSTTVIVHDNINTQNQIN